MMLMIWRTLIDLSLAEHAPLSSQDTVEWMLGIVQEFGQHPPLSYIMLKDLAPHNRTIRLRFIHLHVAADHSVENANGHHRLMEHLYYDAADIKGSDPTDFYDF